MRVSVLMSMLLFVAGTACNNSDFAGAARKGAADAKPKKSVEGEDLGDEDETDLAGRGDDGEDDGSDTPNADDGDDTSGNTDGDTDIVDILAGLLGSESDIVPNQPDGNTIDFGDDTFFHIGDNALTNTTCKLDVTLASLAGTQFFFEFEVKKADTDVALEINRVCGVDYGDSNEVRILNASTNSEVTKQIIPAGDTPIKVEGKGLATGKYVVVVESLANAASEGDRDDYLVGKVKLRASKPIKAGKVGAK